QRRLSDADGYALAFLAAGADAVVELEIVAHHGHARQHVRSIADERGALHGRTEPAVLDEIRFARREHELAGRDVHLAAAEVHRVDAAFDRGADSFRRVRPGAHVRVRHAWQRDVRERFAPAVAGRGHAQQTGVQFVLQIPAQHAVFDERGALCGRALVVDVQRSATPRQRAVVYDRAGFRGDALA